MDSTNWVLPPVDHKPERLTPIQIAADLAMMSNPTNDADLVWVQTTTLAQAAATIRDLNDENTKLKNAAHLLADRLGRYTGRPEPHEFELAMEGKRVIESRYID